MRFLNSGAGNRYDDGATPGGNSGDFRDHSERLQRARLGLGIALVIALMLFLVFAATFVALWLAAPEPSYAWRSIPLPIALLSVNTLLLLLSSVAIELARRQATRRAVLEPIVSIPGISIGEEHAVPWLPIALALGCAFVAGQAWAWRDLAAQGYLINSGQHSTFFYLITILHAIHVGGGLIAMGYAVGLTVLRRPWATRQVVVDIVAWYWHFLAGLWVFIFGLLLMMR